jgi:hypothetical protein
MISCADSGGASPNTTYEIFVFFVRCFVTR